MIKVYRPSRQEIMGAFEKGISAAGDKLSTNEKAQLREIARTSESVAFGAFSTPTCGCPMAVIGATQEHPAYKAFTEAYDARMTELVGHSSPRGISIHYIDDRRVESCMGPDMGFELHIPR